jgi:hypothetical protein
MKIENKESELLSTVGKAVIKYMDYIFVFFTFPIIFDIRLTDPKNFIALGVLIVVRAIMPLANYITAKENKNTKNNKIDEPQQVIQKEEPNGDVLCVSHVDNTNLQSAKIEFPALGKICTKKLENEEVLVSFPDFRTLRLSKKEIMNLCAALLESKFTFFKSGAWTLKIIANKKN